MFWMIPLESMIVCVKKKKSENRHNYDLVLLSGETRSGASTVQNIEQQVMSPKGRKAENFMICSQPPTPRLHDEEKDDWTTVCSHCQDIMQPDDPHSGGCAIYIWPRPRCSPTEFR
eukprot:6347307-Amphidinium_carterae.1